MFSTKNNNRKIIGIVGGLGPYAGMDFERKIFDAVSIKTEQDYPEVIMISSPCSVADRTNYILNPIAENPAIGICYMIKKLASAGATHIAIPCNTAHSSVIMNQIKNFIDLNNIDVVLFDIVEETYKFMKARDFSKTPVLFATYGTYHSNVFHDVFEKENEFRVIEPDEDGKKLIWDSIYSKEFGVKMFSNPVKDKAVENLKIVAEKMLSKGYDTFIMGCTEIPLAMGRLRLPVKLIDPTKILARALVKAVCPEQLKSEL